MSIRSAYNWTGSHINGVLLGDPVIQDDGSFLWDDSMIGDGDVDETGVIWGVDDNGDLIEVGHIDPL